MLYQQELTDLCLKLKFLCVSLGSRGLLILIELNLRHLKAGTKDILLLDFAVLWEVALRCTLWTRALFKVANRFVLAGTGNEQTNKLALRINYSM
jgi:hypothetical protein